MYATDVRQHHRLMLLGGDIIITGKYDNKAVLTLKLMGPSTTRGHDPRLAKECQDRFTNFFSSRIVNVWNSLHNDVISAKTVNCSKTKLDEFRQYQDVEFEQKSLEPETGVIII